MSLPDEARQRLREEEIFRAEVRRSIEAKPSSDLWSRLSAFLETKIGFWLLTTVFAGLSVFLFTSFLNWFNRDEIEERRIAEKARQDFDTVVKIMPMLTSEQASHRQIGLSLLNGLASAKTIQPELAVQITAALQSIVADGARPNAPAEAQARAAEVARLVDAPRSPAEAPAGAPAARPDPASNVAAAISAVQLPPRVYIQIGAEQQRSQAEKALEALRAIGVLAPGIESVRSVPGRNELRYCETKVYDDTRDAVLEAVQPVVGAVRSTPLPPNMCNRVRPNHFELWLASGK